MRALVLVLVSNAAFGDPTPAPDPKDPPRVLKQAARAALADPAPDPWDSPRVLKIEPGVIVVPDLPKPTPGAPAYGGGWAAGQIITPPDHPDARDYPKGMVIRPPRTGDERAWPNGIWLVPDWGKPGDFLRGLGDGLQDGLGALGQLLALEHH